VKVVLGWIIALLFIIGVSVGIVGAVGVGQPPRSELAHKIDQFAMDRAALANDPRPTEVEWVSTTLGAATDVLSGPTSGSSGLSTPVYAMEIIGNFQIVGSFPEPPQDAAAPAPSGTVLFYVVDQANWRVDGTGLGKSVIPLVGLGAVETDSLTGVLPTSP
jgi:hypothetical protein